MSETPHNKQQSNSSQKALYERLFNVKNCPGFYRLKCQGGKSLLMNKNLNYMSILSSLVNENTERRITPECCGSHNAQEG